jgi:hypothetical protein
MYEEAPLRTQVIDPLQISVLPGGPRRFSHIIRKWKMTVWDIEQRWDVKLPNYVTMNSSQKMQQQTEVTDFWHIKIEKRDGKPTTIVEQALVSDGHVIMPLREMKGYDDIPYTVGFFKPINKNDSSGWHGIIRPIESTITFLEKAVNRRGRQIFVYSALPMVARTIPQRPVNLDPALGNLVQLDINEALEFPVWPGNAPDVENHIGFLRARLQQAGFTDVMFGSGPSQVSGYALSQLGDQSRIRLTQPIQHLELMWASWARKTLRLVKQFVAGSTQIRVYGQMKGQTFTEQMKAEDLAGFMIRAEIKPEYPNEKVRNHAMAAQVKDTLSETTIMERYLDVDQPDDERKRRLQDIAVNHPMMQQFAIMRYLVEIAQTSKDKIMRAAATMTLQTMMGGGQPQQQVGPGQPQAPTRPGNALGTQSAGGGPTPQAAGAPPAGSSFQDILNNMVSASPGMTPGGGSV